MKDWPVSLYIIKLICKMESATNNLIAAVERINTASKLVVANENNDAHLTAILADVEFNSHNVVLEFLQMNVFTREWFLEQVYNMHDDSSLADDRLRSVLRTEEELILIEKAKMELEETKITQNEVHARIIASNIASRLESNTTTDDDKVKLQALALHAASQLEEYENVRRLYENLRRTREEQLAARPHLNKNAVMHLSTKLCQMTDAIDSLMALFEQLMQYNLIITDPAIESNIAQQ